MRIILNTLQTAALHGLLDAHAPGLDGIDVYEPTKEKPAVVDVAIWDGGEAQLYAIDPEGDVEAIEMRGPS